MFRHVFAFLLINTYYSSLGNPIETNTSKYLLSNALAALADRCADDFLTNHIKNRIDDCAVIAPPYSEKQFECLMFYDINSQLCAVAPTLKLIAEDTAKINAEQNVNNLCINAKDWVFSNLTDYVQYKNSTDIVFKHPVTCGKICGVEDVTSEDANFYCKYYKWGSDILKNIASGTQSNVDGNAVMTPALSATVSKVDNKATLTAPNSNNINRDVVSDQPTTSAQASVQSTPTKAGIDKSNKNEEKPETSSLKINSSPNAVSESHKSDETDLNVNKVNIHDGNNPSSAVEKPSVAAIKKNVDTEKDAKSEAGKQAQEHNVGKNEHTLDSSRVKDQNDADDYIASMDSEEGKEGLDNQGVEDGQDPGDMEYKAKLEIQKQVEYTLNIDSSHRKEFTPNAIEEAFAQNDDHFFPFFLSAIILVVLMYVLYHNKNKVSKVIMGLILEGRQTGRRRNSRGHAYRRLDTLEQAMSANTGAPPSKIIY